MTTETTGRTLWALLLLLGLAACGDTPDPEKPEKGAGPAHTRAGEGSREAPDDSLIPRVTALRDGPGWLVRVQPPEAALRENRIRSLRVVCGDFNETRKGDSLGGLLLFHLPPNSASCTIQVVDQKGTPHQREFTLP